MTAAVFGTMSKTRTFKIGNSIAVRLPEDIAFAEGVELVAVRSGEVLTLYPTNTSLPEMVRQLESMPAPQEIEPRDVEEIPERDQY